SVNIEQYNIELNSDVNLRKERNNAIVMVIYSFNVKAHK
ncbi:unnamed protein product, partial [marine sediment metagenome]